MRPSAKEGAPRLREPTPAPCGFSRTKAAGPAQGGERALETAMGKGKMSGDNSADSKKPASKARGSGGTMKNQNAGKQDNNKAENTKSNRQ
jgi:hypothetical protein